MPIKITIPATEMYDSVTQMFIDEPEVTIELEHSLVSLSKWESSTGKAFLGPAEKTDLEVKQYIHAMCLDPDVPLSTILRMDNAAYELVNSYIDRKQTATWFTEIPGRPQQRSREVVTAELIYYWIVSAGMPVEVYETWPLSRLFTQLKVFSEKNKKPTKMSKADTMSRHQAAKARNRALLAQEGAKA